MSNDILNSLLKEYDQKKLKAEFECDERKNNLYRLIPRLQEIDNELNSFAFKTAKNILNNSLLSDNSNNSYTVENLEEKIKNLKNCLMARRNNVKRKQNSRDRDQTI